MIRLCLALIVAIYFVGYVSNKSLDDCIGSGNSPKACFTILNP